MFLLNKIINFLTALSSAVAGSITIEFPFEGFSNINDLSITSHFLEGFHNHKPSLHSSYMVETGEINNFSNDISWWQLLES
jgi:hypothetical protein